MNPALQEAPPAAAGARAWSPAGASGTIAALGLALFYLVTCLYIARHRLFWYDELFTVDIAWLPRARDIWAALRHAVDAQPPLYYLVVRSFGGALGRNEVAARLPSALGVVAGLLLVFACARRLTNALHALIALAVPTCSILLYYGYEARPYGLFFLLSALALWIWTGPANQWTSLLFGVALFLGCMIHYYFLLTLVPYCLWELLHWRPWQLPSGKLMAGVAGTALALAINYPVIASFAREFPQSIWGTPSWPALEDVFTRLFPTGFFLLPLIVIWVALACARGQRQEMVLPPMSDAESLGWLFLCIPLAGFVLAEWKHEGFIPRYFIGALPGIAMAFACWLWRHFRDFTLVPLGIFLLLMATGVTRQLAVVHHPDDPMEQSTTTRQYLELEARLHREGKRVLLFSRPLLYLEAEYYSPHRSDYVFLLPSALEDDPHFQTQRGLVRLQAFYPLQIAAPPFDLRTHAGEIALIQPTAQVLDEVNKAGLTAETRFAGPIQVMYLH